MKKMWTGGGGKGRLCVRVAFNPQKHPDGSCSVQMGTKNAETHTHRQKIHCRMLELLSNTLRIMLNIR